MQGHSSLYYWVTRVARERRRERINSQCRGVTGSVVGGSSSGGVNAGVFRVSKVAKVVRQTTECARETTKAVVVIIVIVSKVPG